MNENKPADDAHAQRRRRVLRGALSAPVVLTISNGAGAQMTSNRRCVAHQADNAATRTIAPGTTTTAAWVRVQLRKSGATYYVGYTEINARKHPSAPNVSWIQSGRFRVFNYGTNSIGPVDVTLSPAPPLTSPAQYAVLQIDRNGIIRTVGGNISTTTSMIAATCWASFRAGPL